MNKAVEILNSEITNNAQHPENIVILTDSLLALQYLESNYQKTSTDLTILDQSLDALLGSFKIQITLQWIPGHIGIQEI